jgi:CRP-like cAMP-binding protein
MLVVLAWRRLKAIDASMAHRDIGVEVLKEVAMFRPLPITAVDNLARHVEQAEYTAGQVVFHQGDHGDRFYVIADGEAEVIGDGRVIPTLVPGDGFGEIALLRDITRTSTVSARTALRLFTLDRHQFLPAVSGYQSSMLHADLPIGERLGTFDPGR